MSPKAKFHPFQEFSHHQVPKPILIITALSSIVYLSWWFNFTHVNFWPFYLLLLLGEIYHVWQALGFIYTIWGSHHTPKPPLNTFPEVDIFITVCGEPRSVVEKTLRAALRIKYPSFNIHLLNDGFTRNKPNWKEIEVLATEYDVNCITRKKPGGFKAGNINHALKLTHAPLIAIFDADHVPQSNFLSETIPYFTDDKLALVQTPQLYANSHQNPLTAGAWEQQELFFGPICIGKNSTNSAFWCGTNAVIKRQALEDIGGLPTQSIAEDFLASLLIHQKGYKTLYLPQILAKGLAPHNLISYAKQQFRWARGSLEVIFRHNLILKRGLSWPQKFQYLYSASYYLNGLFVLIDALIPLVVLYTGITPIKTSPSFIIFFLPFISSILYTLMLSTNFTITFRATQLSVSTFFIQIQAFIGTIFHRNYAFSVTSKVKTKQSGGAFAIPHLIYAITALIIIIRAVSIWGITAGILNNTAWVLFNVSFFYIFIRIAKPWNLPAQQVSTFLKNLATQVTIKSHVKSIFTAAKKACLQIFLS